MSVVLALAASVIIGVGAALQQRAATDEDPHAVMDPRLVFRLLRRRVWLIGMGAAIVGFSLQATAIATGRLVVVEPIMAAHVLFALLAAARHSGLRLRARELRGAAMALLGVAGFLVVAAPKEGLDTEPVVPWAVPLGLLFAVVVVGVLVARQLDANRRGLVLAMCAGLSFGTSDALLKLFTEVGGDHGISQVLSHWSPFAWMVVSPMAFLLQQSAFHAAPLASALPGSATLSPTSAALLGALMFGEQIRTGWAIPAEVLFGGLMLAGVAVLSSSPLIEPEATVDDLAAAAD